eukprot:snap_masked-scaffold128_size327099-processed-gene-2.3 protein:Tk06468 transcript:snap_masked-scaffold128_size327099-processed-gene-2.3-mRNA-1 annotation:"nucleolar protein 12"
MNKKSNAAFDFTASKAKPGAVQKRPINRAKKTSITFDPAQRKDFLTGFRKRKDERRKKAKEQRDRELKEEIKKAKEKARADVTECKSEEFNTRVKEDLERFLPSEVVDHGTHTVTVTHVENLVNVKEYFRTFLHLSSRMAFILSVRRWRGVLAYDLSLKSSWTTFLMVYSSTSSSLAILRMEDVGSTSILALTLATKASSRFKLCPPLPGFLWRSSPSSMAILMTYAWVLDIPTVLAAVLTLTPARSKSDSRTLLASCSDMSMGNPEDAAEENSGDEEVVAAKAQTKKEKKATGRLLLKQVQDSKAYKANQRISSKKDAKKNKFSRKNGGKSKRDKHFHPSKVVPEKRKK